MSTVSEIHDDPLEELLRHLARITRDDEMPDESTPLGKLTREFLANNWAECHDGLLSRTTRIRLWPEFSPAPREFHFQIDCPYKRKLGADQPVELAAGPVSGRIIYRGDMLENPDGPTVAVLIDRQLGYFHPNYARDRGLLCLGDQSNLPPGPLPLESLLANHVYPIVTYQNLSPAHPADMEAARYFALDPTAMDGLEPAAPLY